MRRTHRILALLLLPILGGGLMGLRWMHEAVAHGNAEICGHASTCGGSESHHHHHHHGCHHDMPSSEGESSTTDADPASSECLDCDFLAVMVIGGADHSEAPLVVQTDHPVADRVCSVRPLASLSAVRARPPPVA